MSNLRLRLGLIALTSALCSLAGIQPAAAAPIATSTYITVAPASLPQGSTTAVTLTSDSHDGNGNTDVPAAGTITFKLGTTTVGTSGVSNLGQGTLTVYIDPAHLNLAQGIYTFSATYSGNGNRLPSTSTATNNFTVTVGDSIPPTSAMTVTPGTPNGQNGYYNTAVELSFAASDTGSGVATLHYSINGTAQAVSGTTASATLSTNGTNTITYYAVDNAGNAEAPHTATIKIDTTHPVITVPADITVSALHPAGEVVTFSVSATDNIDGAVAAVATPASGSTFPVGRNEVHVTATDSAGNTSSVSFTVTVEDTTPPVITVPADITLEATSTAGAVATYAASAVDVIDGTVAAVPSPASGSTFPIGRSTVTVTAADSHNNTSTATFNVTVVDTTAPSITVPAPITAEATSAAGAVVNFTVSGTDLGDGVVVATATPASGSTFPLGVSTVVVTATDSHGNSSNASFTVTVQDTTCPIIAAPDNITTEAHDINGGVVNFTLSAIDLVDGPVAATSVPASGSHFPIGVTQVCVTAADSRGNSCTKCFNVIVSPVDHVINTPGDMTVEATSAAGAVVNFVVTCNDPIDGAITPVAVPASGSVFPIGKTRVNVTATDSTGAVAESYFDVTVVDTTAPAITVPSDLTVEATGAAGAAVSFSVSASDAVDGSVSPTAVPASGSTFPIGVNTVQVTAADAHGNSSTASFKITVVDTTAPALTLPGDLTVEATGPTGAVVNFDVSANDLVDGTVNATVSSASGSTFPLGTTLVNVTAADSRGNTAYGSFTIHVQDTTPPDITVPADITAEAQGPDGAHVDFTVTATDLVDQHVHADDVPASGFIFPIGTTTVTVSAEDDYHNKSTKTFKVTVVDTTPPVITVPADITVEASSAAGAIATFSVSAQDLVDGAVTATATPASGSTFPAGTTTVNVTATDKAGNTSTASFKVTVVDTTPPVITVPSDITAEATSSAGAVVSFSVSANDAVDGTVAAAAAPASGSTFALGETTVVVTAADKSGNSATASFKVTVVDTTPPAITVPANITAEATSAAGAVVNFTVSANDIVDGAVTATAVPASGSTFALGATTVNVTAVDAHGNSAAKSFTVTVQDTTPPAITVPSDITAEATSAAGAVVSFTVSATDTVDGTVAAIATPASGSTFALGTTTVNVTATDKVGNAASASFRVTVVDTTAPVVTVPADITAEATSAAGAVVSFTVSASDIVDGTVAATAVPASGSTFPVGVTTVNVTATDKAGNTGSASFKVTVLDTTPPVITVPADITAEATDANGAAVTFSVSAQDAVDGSVSAIATPASGSTFALGATTVNVTATDKAGNTATKSFTVTVRDTTAPVITVPANITVEATSAAGALANFQVSATDTVDGAVTAIAAPASGSTFALGTTTVNVTATDKAGNTATKSFTVTVRDTTAPVIGATPDISAAATSTSGAAVSFSLTATDAVDPKPVVSSSPASGSTFAVGTTTVTVTARDASGNSSTKSFKVVVGYSWSGFLQPINNDNSSIFKLGSTVPVKFQLTGASAGITNGSFKLYYAKVTDNVVGTEVEATSTAAATTGNLFRYDATSNQYIFNWGTKGLSIGTYELKADLGDGVLRTVRVALK